MQITTLQDCDFAALTACFNEAFSDYFVPFKVDETYLRERWHAAQVDYLISQGAFIDGQLVGFMMIAIAGWEGQVVHYNAGTGIIPSYRGQGIVGEMYASLLSILKHKRIDRGLLEVIVQNERAVKAYRKVGYQIEREFACFKGDFPVLATSWNAHIQPTAEPDWKAYNVLSPFVWSWDSQERTARRFGGAVECWEYRRDDQLLAFAIYHRATKRLVQWGEAFGEAGSLDQLLLQALSGEQGVRANNIDTKAPAEIERMSRLGLKPSINQYEMWLETHP
ncbi:MAG: GNAT family N-acetyltransferase [Bacteroidota bacterium]